MKPLAHRSQWRLPVRTITTTRIRLIQDHHQRILQQVRPIQALHVRPQHTLSHRIQGLQERHPLHTQVLRVLHQATVRQVTVRQRLLPQDQHRLIQLHRVQRHHIVRRLHLVRLQRARAQLRAHLQELLHRVKDPDAKKDVKPDVSQDA